MFRSQMDAELSEKIYTRIPVLIDEALDDQGNPWSTKFMTIVQMSHDSHLFVEEPASDRLPLYEAKLIHHYDHRWDTSNSDGSSRDVIQAEKQDPGFEIIPRYWINEEDAPKDAEVPTGIIAGLWAGETHAGIAIIGLQSLAWHQAMGLETSFC